MKKITVEEYDKIVEYCNNNIFPIIYKENFKQTFFLHDFKKLITDIGFSSTLGEIILDSTPEGHSVMLYVCLHDEFKNWLKSKSEDFVTISKYIDTMDVLQKNIDTEQHLKYLDEHLEEFRCAIDHFQKKPKYVMSKDEILSFRSSGYLTVGALKEFIKKNELPDDAIVVTQRIEDGYFEGIDVSGMRSTEGIVPQGTKSAPWGVYLKSQNFPDDTQYHPTWCCPVYTDEKEILFIDSHY